MFPSCFFFKVDFRQRTKSFPGNVTEPSHSRSNPVIGSHKGVSLPYVKSEGAATLKKRLDARKLPISNVRPPQEKALPNERNVRDDSSEESGGEDDVIVRIDSPSVLSFHQVP